MAKQRELGGMDFEPTRAALSWASFFIRHAEHAFAFVHFAESHGRKAFRLREKKSLRQSRNEKREPFKRRAGNRRRRKRLHAHH